MVKKFIYAIIAVLILNLVFFNIPFGNAQAEVGGESFDDATLVGEGKHDLGIIEDMQSKYIKVNVAAGQEMEAAIESQGYDRYGEFRLYIPPNKEKVRNLAYDPFPQTLIFAPGNLDTSKGGEVFIEVMNRQGGEEGRKSITVTIKLRDVSDGGTGKDAGDSFNGAMRIKPGKIRGYLSAWFSGDDMVKDRGTDVIDFYALKLKKGDTLSVEAAPHESAILAVRIYDKSRKIVKDEKSDNEGAIVGGKFVAKRSQVVYIALQHQDASEGRYYDLHVKIKPKKR